jgi:hypothetical protein
MTPTEHFELIWKTYEFTLTRLTFLEDDYQYLFAQINNKLSENDKRVPADLKQAFIENARELKLIYVKQQKTINELISFCDEHRAWKNSEIIPEGFDISKDSLKELSRVTRHLEEVLEDSVENVESLLDY